MLFSTKRPPLLQLPTADGSPGCYLASVSASQLITSNRTFSSVNVNAHHTLSKHVGLIHSVSICTIGMDALAQSRLLLFPGVAFRTHLLSASLVPHLDITEVTYRINKTPNEFYCQARDTFSLPVTWLGSQLMQSKTRACHHFSQCQYSTQYLSACRTLWLCHASLISPCSAKDLHTCLSLSL